MSDLKVGDVCIVIGNSGHPWSVPIGTEITILKLAQHSSGQTYYAISVDDGDYVWAYRGQLKPKQLPSSQREQIGEWELCPWQPSGQTVTTNDG